MLSLPSCFPATSCLRTARNGSETQTGCVWPCGLSGERLVRGLRWKLTVVKRNLDFEFWPLCPRTWLCPSLRHINTCECLRVAHSGLLFDSLGLNHAGQLRGAGRNIGLRVRSWGYTFGVCLLPLCCPAAGIHSQRWGVCDVPWRCAAY
jgi:hypothetical protein